MNTVTVENIQVCLCKSLLLLVLVLFCRPTLTAQNQITLHKSDGSSYQVPLAGTKITFDHKGSFAIWQGGKKTSYAFPAVKYASFTEVLIPVRVNEFISICEGKNYQGWNATGIYERTIQASTGGDSIVTTHLTVFPSVQAEEAVTICPGESYLGWSASGTYQRFLTNVSGCDSTVSTRLTVIQPVPPAITVKGDTLKAPDSYTSYQWCDSAGEIPGATHSGYIIPKSGQYHLVVTDVNGCSVSSANLNLVYSAINATLAKELRPRVIPNPNSGEFIVRMDTPLPDEGILTLINASGQPVETRTINSNQTNTDEYFDIPHLPKGMYFMQIITKTHLITEKIIVQ
jgi:hypothetical protein